MKKRLLLILIGLLVIMGAGFSQKVIYTVSSGSDAPVGKFGADKYFVGGNTWSPDIFHGGYLADISNVIDPTPNVSYTSVCL